MIFRQVVEIKTGVKTMTQRVDDGGYTWDCDGNGNITHVYKNGRLKWQVGKVYAAVPKRGMKQFGSYRITRIRHRPVQTMTEADAYYEGVKDLADYRTLWDSINGAYKGKRWQDNPTVFAIEFRYLGSVETD